MALALLVFVYATVVNVLATQRLPNDLLRIVLAVIGTVLGTLMLAFCYWLICLLVACAGYWSAFILFRRLRIDPNRITLASIFAFITVFAAVTAIMKMNP